MFTLKSGYIHISIDDFIKNKGSLVGIKKYKVYSKDEYEYFDDALTQFKIQKTEESKFGGYGYSDDFKELLLPFLTIFEYDDEADEDEIVRRWECKIKDREELLKKLIILKEERSNDQCYEE